MLSMRLAILALLALVLAADTGLVPTAGLADIVPDEYIVLLEPSISDIDFETHAQTVASIVSGATLRVQSLFPGETSSKMRQLLSSAIAAMPTTDAGKFKGVLRQYDTVLRGYHGHLPRWLADVLRQSSLVTAVEENQRVYVQQSDYSLVQPDAQWSLARISSRDNPAKSRGSRYVYPRHGGSGVDVYVVDTGVSVENPDFEGRAVNGESFVEGGSFIDGVGHGTHVAGIVASKTYGVAKSARVVSVRVFDSDGGSTMANLLNGLDYVTRATKASGRRSVVNLSLGRAGWNTSVAYGTTMTVLNGLGIAVAAAAGNGNEEACAFSPANSSLVLTVGASDANDSRAPFSNYGSCIDIYAPGVDITSILDTNRVRTLSGTSMATPHVSGVMALVLSEYPTVSIADLYTGLRKAATPGMITNITSEDPNLLLYSIGPAGTGVVDVGAGAAAASRPHVCC
ncbi:peptidase S8/S53 domain-containing protein [Entophlyctis helioformis]|nr:peptidase S8/S53 domain-containing protein [Entophlyctis helioformis]